MAIDYVRNIISSGYNLAKINDNFAKIETALQDAVSRSGNSPNQMEADFDMNSNDILNAKDVYADRLYIDGVLVIPGDVTAGLIATQAQAEAGVENTRIMTPLRTKQAVTSYGFLKTNNLSEVANPSTARTNLGLAIGVNVQAYDAGLQSIAGLTTAADQMIYTTGADLYATTALTPFARTLLDDADATALKSTLGLVAIASSGSANDLTSGTVPNLRLPARIQETWLGVTDWNTAVTSGWYFGAAGATNAPDGSDYVVMVIAGGGNFTQQFARAFGSEKEFVREQTSGVWGAWLPRKSKDVTSYGALGDGTTPAQTAFTAAIAAQVARINTIPAYAAMPQAPDCEVHIPSGLWHLTADVDPLGKSVTWVVDNGAQFTSGSSAHLLGRIVRPTRRGLGFPFGLLDHATGDSVMVGEGSTDNSPLVTGFTNPNQVSTNSTIDLVARYTDATSTPILHTSTATFTATTCTLTTPIATNLLRVGMVIQTTNVPFERGQVTSWNGAGTVITCGNGWYRFGAGTGAVTPPSGTVLFNPFDKVWGQNTNTFLLGTSYGYQSTGHEIGIWNDKVTPTNVFDSSGRSWGEDVVNLGPLKANLAFLARGAMFNGFMATGMDVGFNATAYTDLGYATPGVAYQYTGGGTTISAFNASAQANFNLTGNTIEFGTQGASNTPSIQFHTGATNTDYDAIIFATGGDGVTGNGTLQIDNLLTLTRNLRPASDNAYQLGGGSNRWTVVFATTGTINTSDERFKRFLDAYNEMENDRLNLALSNAISRLKKRIRLYQWNDALAEKGEDARFHVGLSAQEVDKIFSEEGLDARRFALFCEEDEYEQVEVETYSEVQDTEEVIKEIEEQVEEDDRIVFKKITKIVNEPKTVQKPIFKEDGTRVVRDQWEKDEFGNIVYEYGRPKVISVPSFATVPVMKKIKLSAFENKPILNADGTQSKRLGLRYDQLLLLMIREA